MTQIACLLGPFLKCWILPTGACEHEHVKFFDKGSLRKKKKKKKNKIQKIIGENTEKPFKNTMLFDRFWDPKNGRKIAYLLGVFYYFGGLFLGPFWVFSGVGFALRGQFSRYTKSQPFKGVRAVRVAVRLGGFK